MFDSRSCAGKNKLLVVVIQVFLFFAACGLDREYIALSPPVFDADSTTTNNLGFLHNQANDGNPSFEGYEIYYKFYGTGEDTANGFAEYNLDYSRIAGSSGLSPDNLTNNTLLSTFGYSRIRRIQGLSTVSPQPFLEFAHIADPDAAIVLDFSPGLHGEPSLTNAGITIFELARANGKRFFNIEATDDDIIGNSAKAAIQNNNSLRIGFIIFAYGLNITTAPFAVKRSTVIMGTTFSMLPVITW